MSKRESFGSTLDKELLNDLRKASEETGIPISKLLDRAVTLLLDSAGLPLEKYPRGSQRTSRKHPNLRQAEVAENNNEPYRIDINLPEDK